MANPTKFLNLTRKSIQNGQMTQKGISVSSKTTSLTVKELRLTDKETQMLKHDLTEVSSSFAQLGLMVVGLIPGWGEPADATSAAIDYATGHPISGTISLLCTCPIAGWLADIPLLGIRIFRISSATLKCGKTMFVIAKTGKRAEKIFAWLGGKVVQVSHSSKTITVIQKNVFDPKAQDLYIIFEKLERIIKREIPQLMHKSKAYIAKYTGMGR